jgi:DNA replication protein DnaC
MINATKEKLESLKLKGMLADLERQLLNPNFLDLSFEDRLEMLVNSEFQSQENRRLTNRLKKAKLKNNNLLDDFDFRIKRGLDKSFILSFASCEWIKNKLNIIITGPTGVGKSYLANALSHRACVEGFTAIYYRLPRLLEEFLLSHADGSYTRFQERLKKFDLLILDDWGLTELNSSQSQDLLDIIEDRDQVRSTIIISQVPVEEWFKLINNVTIADAIMDRLVNGCHRIKIQGESMRKKNNEKIQGGQQMINKS